MVRVFIGDRFVDDKGDDVTSALVKEGASASGVAWPVKVMHAKCHRYLDTDIIEQDGPEEVEFVAKNFLELDCHQDDKL